MIDKNIPLKFVSDKDERLLKSGDMTDAQNITITERGAGSGSIVKTFKGFQVIAPASGQPDLETNVKVIGQVEDPERNFIYFFVATTGSGHVGDMIVRYSGSAGKYKIVFQNTWLNFDADGFVKADVVSKSFERDGVVKTIVYFTDNNNPPRKINIDRALDGDYDDLTNSELDIALSAMRAAPTAPPTFKFETDSSVTENNFEQNVMQFATQIIYKDGEESALSPYSKLAVSQAGAFGGLETTSYNVARYTENVCKISHNIPLDYPDVKRVRILARKSNSGGFFVVDEFDPNTNVRRDLYSNNVKVYDKTNGQYTFFNNVLGRTISDTVAQKLYDNVPLKAEGQSIVGSRLMFSNYVEGRGNNPLNPSLYSIVPKYSDLDGGTSNFISSGDDNGIFATASPINVTVSLEGGASGNITGTTAFDAGTLVTIEFNFNPEFTITDSGDVISFLADEEDLNNPQAGGSGTFTSTTLDLTDITTNDKSVSVSYVTPETFNTDELADYIQSQLQFIEGVFLDYTVDGQAITSTTLTDTTMDCTARVFFEFGETVSATNDVIVFEPRITRIALLNVSLASQGSISFTPGSTLDVYENSGNNQNEVTFSDIVYTLSSKSIGIASNGSIPTFKSGAGHSFGIVYYDKWGRSGFVNELGEVYVDSPPERSSGRGSVAMKFDLSDTGLNPPDWAESYQIVYSGSTVSNVVQYTVGGAYPRRLTTSTGSNYDIDTSVHNIYVSLKTLDHYRRDKDVLRDYSFTKGDKLRIISHKNSDDTSIVGDPLSSTSNLMEFDIVGVETFEGLDGAPIRKSNTAASESDTNPHEGTFLVLTAPAVEASSGTQGGVEKYVGFDWYQITGTDYNSTDTVSLANYWNREVLVEIITPKQSTAEKVYYEIGERRSALPSRDPALGDHGPAFTIVSGDVHYRPISSKVPTYNTSGSTWRDNANENPETWDYVAKYVEDPSTSDLFESKAWDRGRSHAVFQDAAEVNRYNGITYSEAYADDTATLTLSSFTPSLANFFDLPSENGACTYIAKLNDKLIGIQENKASIIGVNKGVIETGSQSGLISLSTQVLQNILPFGVDYGTQNPESVLIKSGVVYFADKSRQAIIRLSERSYDVISDIDIKSFVDSEFSSWDSGGSNKLFSGYDPDDDIYYLTFAPGGSYTGMTLGFDEKGDFWQGKYTFYPDMYSRLKDKMIVCKYVSVDGITDSLLHKTNETSNSFPGAASRAESKVTVVSNTMPSVVKSYESISIEADSKWNVDLETSSGQTTASLDFVEKEDAFYALVTGDTSSNSQRHFLPVGTVESVGADTITMKSSLRGLHIPLGYRLAVNDGSSSYVQTVYTVIAVDRDVNTITASADFGGAFEAGDRLFVFSEKSVNGDQIRGHYCKINCSITPSATNREELYAINAKFSESRANHGLTQ